MKIALYSNDIVVMGKHLKKNAVYQGAITYESTKVYCYFLHLTRLDGANEMDSESTRIL